MADHDPNRPSSDRRQLLKVMLGGVAAALILPTQWTKPLVNSVIVPAHAAASAPATTVAPVIINN